MFHASTTIRHSFRQNPMKTGEKRLCYGALDKMKAFGGGVVSTAKSMANPIRIATWPIRAPFKPVWWGLKGGYNVAKKGVDASRSTVYAGKEVAAGVLWDGLVQPGLTMGLTPVWDVKMNIVDNFRDITKGIIKAPLDILRMPGNFVGGVRESVSTLLKTPGKYFDAIKSLSPRNVISTTREQVGGLLAPITKPLQPLAETPVNVAKNVAGSKLQYFGGMYAAGQQIKGGWQRAGSAPETGKVQAQQAKVASLEEKRRKKEQADKDLQKAEQSQQATGAQQQQTQKKSA